MQRTRSWRRAQRQRIIYKRLNIVMNIWGYGHPESWPWVNRTPSGQYAKSNLTCRPECGLCKPWKRWPGKTWDAKHPATRAASTIGSVQSALNTEVPGSSPGRRTKVE